MIGILGDIPFEVTFDGSNIKTLNFKNLKRNGGSNYEEHKRRGVKPSLELIDISLERLTLDITLRSDLGVNPEELLKKLIDHVETGSVLDFILGDKILGRSVITSYDAGYEYISGQGKVRKIDVSLSLAEYIEKVESNIEIVKKEKKQTTKKVVHEDYNQGAINP